MKITALHTPKVHPGDALTKILDNALPTLGERSVIAVTSKIVSLCENQVLPEAGTDRVDLIRAEADLYNPRTYASGEYPFHFTIKHNTLIPASGIDLSNGNGNYILWPKDPCGTAETIHRHLTQRFKLHELGVIITDSTIMPSRWGTTGVAIGHSGFNPIKNYVGQPDIFGRLLEVSSADIAGALASVAVLAMGEGAEQTPVVMVEDVGAIEFYQPNDPPAKDSGYYISPLEDEPFKPFFTSATWRRGGSHKNPIH